MYLDNLCANCVFEIESTFSSRILSVFRSIIKVGVLAGNNKLKVLVGKNIGRYAKENGNDIVVSHFKDRSKKIMRTSLIILLFI